MILANPEFSISLTKSEMSENCVKMTKLWKGIEQQRKGWISSDLVCWYYWYRKFTVWSFVWKIISIQSHLISVESNPFSEIMPSFKVDLNNSIEGSNSPDLALYLIHMSNNHNLLLLVTLSFYVVKYTYLKCHQNWSIFSRIHKMSRQTLLGTNGHSLPYSEYS